MSTLKQSLDVNHYKNNTIDRPAGDEISKTGLLANSDSDMITQENNNVKFSKDVVPSASSLFKENKKLAEMVDYRKRMALRENLSCFVPLI